MTKEIDTGGPAFPVIAENGLGHVSDGMSLRDYLAAKAMQAILTALIAKADENHLIKRSQLAKDAYLFADAMIEEGKK